MDRLENVSASQLRDYLDDVEGTRETLRLVVGINYKHGVSQSRLAAWYGVSRTTVHNWLDRLERLESEPLEAVIHDDDRPGRPSKLTETERELLYSALRAPPTEQGLDAPAWSPSLVQTYVREEFDVAYTLRHVRELMHDAGIDWQRPPQD